MKKTNKILAIILAILMIISIVPITSSAATYSGACGDNATWTYDSSTYTLTISGAGDMYDYKSNNRPWESYEDKIKTVVIDKGVTTIGAYAFYHCGKLVSVTLPDGITSISEYAFKECKKLKDINIPNGITAINSQTFAFCESLTDITIPDTITTIGERAFYACYGLTEVIIPDSVTIIDEEAFHSCRGLTNISIGKGVTTINRLAFAYCDNLTNIAIQKNVTTIEETAFACCGNLSSITVDSESEYFVNDDYGVLFNKDKTMLIQYPAGSTEKNYTIPNGVTKLCEWSFHDCFNLESVIMPVSVTTIGDCAFSYYTQTIQIYYNDTSNQWNELLASNADTADFLADNYVVHCIDKTLYPSGVCGDSLTWSYDTHLNTLTISGTGDMYNYEYDFGGFGTYPWVVFTFDVEHVIVKDGATSIGICAFVDCQNLIDIELSDSVTIIDKKAFSYCANLTDVYYTGTEEQWKSISIGSYNQPLLDATIHYNYHIHKYDSVVTEPTCTERGYTTYTCECGDSYTDDYIDVIDHEYKTVTTPPTCAEQGYTTYTCDCGDSYIDDYVDALGHTEEIIPSVAPTCTETGLTEGSKCSVCGEILTAQEIVSATGHADNNGDGYCDADNELLDPTVECECNCHKTGIAKFFFNFILFFQKIFGSNEECACGVMHY